MQLRGASRKEGRRMERGHSKPANISLAEILAGSLLFIRNRSVKLSLRSWLGQLFQSENNTTESSSPESGHEGMAIPLVPLQGVLPWEERWEIEEARRNKAQLRIATLPEPQKSVEQRTEKYRQSNWDRNNPRPSPTIGLTTPQQTLR